MQLVLYSNTAEPERVDKSNYLTEIVTLDGDQQELNNNIVSPTFIVYSEDAPAFNYAYIAEYARYYYIDAIAWVGENLFRLQMRCDVLMTYAAEIGDLTAIVARNEYEYKSMLPDGELPIYASPGTDVISSGQQSPFPTTISSGMPCVLITTMEGN